MITLIILTLLLAIKLAMQLKYVYVQIFDPKSLLLQQQQQLQQQQKL